MDTWNMSQLKQMALGGNKKLKLYFQNYDLNDESVQQRYNTRAAEYYRLNLRSQCENMPFGDKQPSYEIGREQIPADEIRSPEEIMGHMNQEQPNQKANADGTDYLSYFSYGAQQLQEKAAYAAQAAKAKAGEVGTSENVKYAQDSLYSLGSKAGEKGYTAAATIQ